jgi:NRAMP (natural resistance-associated macrophage protein)-like metal ion transporter
MTGKIKRFWESLGPGLITGAADNDPSGIATYSIAGARFGMAPLWLLLYMLPFMIAVQSMCARIGALSGCGLAANIKRHYAPWVLAIAAASLLAANIFNIGADIYGMAGALNLIIPINIQLMAVVMAVIMIGLVIILRYRQIEKIFKWFALSLFVYGIALLFVHPNWPVILWHTIIPTFSSTRGYMLAVFAILGTTISPYLFFWQASEEAEEERRNLRVCKYRMIQSSELRSIDRDTKIGMIASNVVSFCIISLTASTLFQAGTGNIETLREAAQALAPLAGPHAFLFFALGIISSGLLAIPVLAGSAAYVVAELMGWPASLDKPFNRARQFYLVMVASVVIGMLLPFIGISPVQALLWSAVINGLVAPLLIVLIVHMSRNPKIVGPHTSSLPMYALGLGALMLMLTGTFFVIIS